MSRSLWTSWFRCGNGLWRCLAGFLILAAAGGRVAYWAYDCPLDLAPDEAHYWDWSRHLDWSYYSKGPLVAYLIRGGTAVAGAWSERLLSNEMLAVRLPALLCGSLLLVSLYLLTRQVYRREDLAAAVVALALTFPMITAGASIMTIDAPYTCCWGWALVLGYQAIFRGSRWAWPAAGLVVGLGILAKYTMVLWVPSAALFLLTSPSQRRLLWRPGFWVLCIIGAACCLPILWWNASHGWVTLHHVSGQAGLTDQETMHWLGPLVYLGAQFGLLLGFWFVIWMAAMIAHRPWAEPDESVRYLWWMSAPMFVVFLLFSFKTNGGEPNWPVTTYESGLVLAVAWLVRQWQSPQRWYRRLLAGNLALACVLGLTLTVILHHSDWVQPVLLRFSGPVSEWHPMPLRRFDPTCRLRGWQTLAAEVDRRREELKREGTEPVLAATNWSLPGELAFYCAGRPVVYSLGLAMGDRHSQYDFWRPNPVYDPTPFVGRTFIVVGGSAAELARGFAQTGPTQLVTYLERGQPITCWSITVCRGFRGFPLPQGLTGPSY
ncbi:MAG: glycosyltransferase family 39 protein [Planctomycetes bacterium]|nr:glycosyltransferase family 39 protein [Planctomycetota bacterium]